MPPADVNTHDMLTQLLLFVSALHSMMRAIVETQAGMLQRLDELGDEFRETTRQVSGVGSDLLELGVDIDELVQANEVMMNYFRSVFSSSSSSSSVAHVNSSVTGAITTSSSFSSGAMLPPLTGVALSSSLSAVGVHSDLAQPPPASLSGSSSQIQDTLPAFPEFSFSRTTGDGSSRLLADVSVRVFDNEVPADVLPHTHSEPDGEPDAPHTPPQSTECSNPRSRSRSRSRGGFCTP